MIEELQHTLENQKRCLSSERFSSLKGHSRREHIIRSSQISHRDNILNEDLGGLGKSTFKHQHTTLDLDEEEK
jgi:hypothetical protein